MANELNMKRLLILTTQDWKELSIDIYGWIYDDMKKGKVQLLTGKTTYNPIYLKYKINFLKRFTTRTYRKGTKNFPPGSVTRAGTNLASVRKGASVRSNSSTPNMMATGDTILGLKYKNSNERSMTMGYLDKDADKILYNEAMGRDIRTLSEENKEKARLKIENKFARNIKEWKRERIFIRVGH